MAKNVFSVAETNFHSLRIGSQMSDSLTKGGQETLRISWRLETHGEQDTGERNQHRW